MIKIRFFPSIKLADPPQYPSPTPIHKKCTKREGAHKSYTRLEPNNCMEIGGGLKREYLGVQKFDVLSYLSICHWLHFRIKIIILVFHKFVSIFITGYKYEVWCLHGRPCLTNGMICLHLDPGLAKTMQYASVGTNYHSLSTSYLNSKKVSEIAFVHNVLRFSINSWFSIKWVLIIWYPSIVK